MGDLKFKCMVEAEAKVQSMRRGNAGEDKPGGGAVQGERDLSLVRGPYWSTRKVPANAHHFRREEFEDYLRAERFPINTLTDRVVEHTNAVRRALVAGVFVPGEVMKDAVGVEALELAEMDVRALAEGEWKLEQQKEAVLLFEQALGYYTPHGKPQEVLRDALLEAARAPLERCARAVDFGIHGWVTGGFKRISLKNHPREILVGMREGCGGRTWVEFRDSGWSPGSLFGEVHRKTAVEVDGVFAAAVAEGEVSLEEARSLMGHRWRPYVAVTVRESAAMTA